MINIIKNFLVILILGFIVFIISHKVLPSDGGISYNDSAHFWNIEDKTDSIISSYSSDYLGTSLLNGVFLYTPKGIITLLLKGIGLNDFWISYILSFGFVFLVSVIGYFIFSKISNSKLFGFVASVFIIFNNISIEYIIFGQYYYYLYLLSIILLFNIFFNIYKKGGLVKYSDVFKLILISLLVILPINLVGYSLLILAFFIFFYIKFGYKKDYIFKLFLTGLFTFIINSYWIIPFFVGLGNTNSGDIYGGNANGVLEGFSRIATYVNIISFRQYFNTISLQLFDSIIVNIFYIFLIVIIFFIGFFTKIKEKSFIIFLLFLYLLFFNFALGPNSAITGEIYKYLWENFSFFNFFRSFTRFSIPLLVIIIFIIALYFSNLKSKRLNNIVLTIATFLIISLHYPLLSGNLKDIIVSIKIPNEYSNLNSIVKKTDTIISYPNIQYETYSWAIGKSKLQIEDYFLKEYIINSPIIYNRASLNLENKNNFYKTIFNNNLEGTLLYDALKNNGIKCVLIQKNLINVTNGEKINYSQYLNYFSDKSKIIIDNNEFTLFDLGNVKEKVFGKNFNLIYSKERSYYYDLDIKNIKTIGDIIFYENFNKNFNLYLKNQQGLFTKPIFENSHKLIYDYANSWAISKDEIINYVNQNYSNELKKEDFPKKLTNGKTDYKYYTLNKDGSINVELTLYFKPQSYFYLGLMISATTFVLLLGYLGFDIVRNRRRKK